MGKYGCLSGNERCLFISLFFNGFFSPFCHFLYKFNHCDALIISIAIATANDIHEQIRLAIAKYLDFLKLRPSFLLLV
nr:MAG TPA: hypothetical protein [Caudoviricetes sp.]